MSPTSTGNPGAFLDDPSLHNGEANAFSVKIDEVRLQNNTRFKPPSAGVTVVVGPNNAGKSTLLREIRDHLHLNLGNSARRRLIDAISLNIKGTPADVVAWLSEHSRYVEHGEQGFVSSGASSSIGAMWLEHSLKHQWEQARETGQFGSRLAPFLIHYADTESRLELSRPAPVRHDAREPAVHPVHVLGEDWNRLDLASKISKSVFGEGLLLDGYSAQNRLKVGQISGPVPRRDEPDTQYRKELTELPDLEQQGDGMRSFFGLALSLITARHPMVLVDEPEAFLHPPQATELGRLLGRVAAENNIQLILATHDRHLLTGLIESEAPLAIVRIDRRDHASSATAISPSELKAIWSEPALRYSNALDGLFHKMVALVESERDAQFYAAALDEAYKAQQVEVPASEVCFVPCGGKGGMAKFASALSNLGVPLAAMPDIDMLNNKALIRKLVKALGGTWSRFEADYNLATARIMRDESKLTVGDIVAVLGTDQKALLTKETRERVERMLRTVGSGWNQIKAGGIDALGQGGTAAAARKLFDSLDEIGLVLVRKGELESFGKELDATKGPGWLLAALTAGVHKTPEAMEQVARLANVLKSHTGSLAKPV